jgi:mRNA interferase HigB
LIVLNAIELERFARKHRDADSALRSWLEVAESANWRNLMDVRQTYPHADGVPIQSDMIATVFNIKGNRYRLIAKIDFGRSVMRIINVLTHAEYDSGRWKGKV